MPRRKGRRVRARTLHARVTRSMDYDALFLAQEGRCGICGVQWVGPRRFDRDHDHKTMKPRGLLCRACNRKLHYQLTLDWLLKAIAYLRRYN